MAPIQCVDNAQASWTLNTAYVPSKRDRGECVEFTKQPSPLSTSCGDLLQQAEPDGNGTITSYAQIPMPSNGTPLTGSIPRQKANGITLSSIAKAGMEIGAGLGGLMTVLPSTRC